MMQLDLLSYEPPRAVEVQSVYDHAEENAPGWKETAARLVRQYAASHAEFISEDCTDWAYEHGLPKPNDPRALGQVYRAEAKAGTIRKGGYGRSVKRASPTVLWISMHPNFWRGE